MVEATSLQGDDDVGVETVVTRCLITGNRRTREVGAGEARRRDGHGLLSTGSGKACSVRRQIRQTWLGVGKQYDSSAGKFGMFLSGVKVRTSVM